MSYAYDICRVLSGSCFIYSTWVVVIGCELGGMDRMQVVFETRMGDPYLHAQTGTGHVRDVGLQDGCNKTQVHGRHARRQGWCCRQLETGLPVICAAPDRF